MKIKTLVFLMGVIAPFARGAMDELPLARTESGHFILEAAVNGKSGRFVFDTGATGSVVGLSKLEHFGINKTEGVFDGVVSGDEESGKIETFPIIIESLAVGNHNLTLKNIYSNSVSNLGPEIDGVIGYDVITELHGLIDVKNNKLLVPSSDDDIRVYIESTGSQYTLVPLVQSDMGFTLVKAKIEQHDVVLLLDSGASQVVLDTNAVTDELGFELKNHPSAKTIAHDGTETPMKAVQNKVLRIGNTEIKSDFLIADFGALKQALGTQHGTFIGVLGNKELASINSIIDVANSVIYVR